MMKLELPDLENLYYSICNMDFYTDLSDKDMIHGKIEQDDTFLFLKKTNDILLQGAEKLEKIYCNSKYSSFYVLEISPQSVYLLIGE